MDRDTWPDESREAVNAPPGRSGRVKIWQGLHGWPGKGVKIARRPVQLTFNRIIFCFWSLELLLLYISPSEVRRRFTKMLAGSTRTERVADEGGWIKMRKSLVAIENWAVVESVISPSFEDLKPGKHLMGNVLGHASLQNTKFIYTSRILNVYPGVVETLNTLYQLGEPSEEYKDWELKRAAGMLPEGTLRLLSKDFSTVNSDKPESRVA